MPHSFAFCLQPFTLLPILSLTLFHISSTSSRITSWRSSLYNIRLSMIPLDKLRLHLEISLSFSWSSHSMTLAETFGTFLENVLQSYYWDHPAKAAKGIYLQGIPASFMLQIRSTSSSVYFCRTVWRFPILSAGMGGTDGKGGCGSILSGSTSEQMNGLPSRAVDAV